METEFLIAFFVEMARKILDKSGGGYNINKVNIRLYIRKNEKEYFYEAYSKRWEIS